MSVYTHSQLDAHEQVLKQRVFLTERIPHFNLLLKDIRKLAAQTPLGATVVSLERGLLYGGFSLLGPFFHEQHFIAVDCSPRSADQRGAYNAAKVNDPDFLCVPIAKRAPIEATGLDSAIADLVLVPNLVHHIADQLMLFQEMARLVKPGGRIYVFEPLVRELHQIPDDYLRYTPYGMQRIMRQVGLEPQQCEFEGGPFSAIGYCWYQALEYFPEDKRAEMEHWFYHEHFPQLLEWDTQYTDNLVREHTCFPMGFSILAVKPSVEEVAH